MRRMRQDHRKVRANHTQTKAAMAGCFAMTSSAYNGTPAQPQTQPMGAVRRDPRKGEIPGVRCQSQFSTTAQGPGSSVE